MSSPSYPCNRCRAPLRWVPEYGRWYCDRCRNYAGSNTIDNLLGNLDRAFDESPRCNICGYSIRFVHEHQRWWCDRCQRYL